ncbi:hypothetical protein BRADI_2g55296v3 [Brachypodium distachyon]|uniref:Uncharacterized protein n=1 Tax=Brachypodium distachyon TaxID=15368 RepID=A0A0Q3KHE1_BRADI|nr:hypothetical protein BRADI_2g55296v3 [Brachypodium distachyon]
MSHPLPDKELSLMSASIPSSPPSCSSKKKKRYRCELFFGKTFVRDEYRQKNPWHPNLQLLNLALRTDRWLHGIRLKDAFPALVACVRPKHVKSRTVREALDGAWLTDVGSNLWGAALQEFLTLWDLSRGIQLVDGAPDSLT